MLETLTSIFELISAKEFSVPLWELLLYVLFISFCLLFSRYRLGLLTSYCFVFYWGFISNLEHFNDFLGNSTWMLTVYIFSGVLMFSIALVSFFVQDKE